MSQSLTPTWQDDFVQDDSRTLYFTNVPVPGNPNATGCLSKKAFDNVAAFKAGIEKVAHRRPSHARVMVSQATLQPQPPFTAFVMFETPADAASVAHAALIKLKGIDCPVKFVRPAGGPNPLPALQQSMTHLGSRGGAERSVAHCDRTVRLGQLPVTSMSPEALQVTSSQKLQALMKEAGYAVEDARLVLDPDTGAPTGVGFVTLMSLPDARQLIREKRVELKGGYNLTVSAAKPPSAYVAATPGPAGDERAPTATPSPAPARSSALATSGGTPTRQGRNFPAEFDQGSRYFARQAQEGSPLHSRPMVPVHASAAAQLSFTAMTWNVLFRDFATHHELYCPPHDVALPVRRGMLRECIARHRPDILALQELEVAGSCAPEEAAYFQKALESLGYEVHSMAKVTAGSQRSMDGCALAFRRDVFAARPSDVRKIRLSDRLAQVGIFARFLHCASGREVVVATTHLKAGPEFERDRQAQMAALLGAVRESLAAPSAAAADVPVVVLGDLNTEPRWELIPGLEAGSAVGPLRDAYANTASGTPPGYTDTPFTSYSWFLQGVADYVLHTDGLVPVKVLKVPGTRDVRALYAADYPQRGPGPRFEMLPCKSFPSDHVPLMVEFAFAPVAADADADAFASRATADANTGGPTRHHDPWSQQPQAPHAAAAATSPQPEAAGWGAARPEPFGVWETRPRPGSNEHATAPAHGSTDDDDVFGGAFDNVDAATDRNACDCAASAEAAVADGNMNDADDCGSSSSSEPCDVDGQL